MTDNIYKRARESAGLTQERAAEFLDLSVESLRAYETNRRMPANDTVAEMADLYHTPHLPIQHLRNDPLALPYLPTLGPMTLEQATLRVCRIFNNFIKAGKLDQLIAIAEDGVIDAQERPVFDEIMRELGEIGDCSCLMQLEIERKGE